MKLSSIVAIAVNLFLLSTIYSLPPPHHIHQIFNTLTPPSQPTITPHLHSFSTLQVPINTTAIPLGFRGSVDSSGIYNILYFLSEATTTTATTTTSGSAPKKSYQLEAMIFRDADFRQGIPTIQQRVPIQKLSVEIRYNRPVPLKSRLQTASFLSQMGIDIAANSTDSQTISFGDQVQQSYVMKPVTDYLFILQSLYIPADSVQDDISLLFTAVVVPTNQEITLYRSAIARGNVPASENPFYTAQLRINGQNGAPSTSSTVTTIMIRSRSWLPLNVATAANPSPAYSLLNINVDNGPLQIGIFSVMRQQHTDLTQVNEIISTLPDEQLSPDPLWPVHRAQISSSTSTTIDSPYVYYIHYAYTQFNNTANTLLTTATKPPTFIPSFYAPRQLLPLASSANNTALSLSSSTTTSATLQPSSATNPSRLANLLQSTTTLVAVTPPSNLRLPTSTLTNPPNDVAYPIQLRLQPFSPSSSQFSIPHYTIGFWPDYDSVFDWVDIQLQMQLVRLATPTPPPPPPTTTPPPNNSTEPGSTTDVEATTEAMTTLSGQVTQSLKNLVTDDDLDHAASEPTQNVHSTTQLTELRSPRGIKMKPMQSASNGSTSPISSDNIEAPIIGAMLSPELVATDLTSNQISQLLSRVLTNTTVSPLLSTLRYNMASVDQVVDALDPTTNKTTTNKRWDNANVKTLYHLDYNLYALRANATGHNNAVEYAIVVFYQFLAQNSRDKKTLVSDWIPFMTKLPTMNETLSSELFPFDPILPNLNSMAFGTNGAPANPTNPNTTTPTNIIPIRPSGASSTTPRTTLQPVRVNERVDLESTEEIVGDPTSGNAPVRSPSSVGTIANPVDETGPIVNNGNNNTTNIVGTGSNGASAIPTNPIITPNQGNSTAPGPSNPTNSTKPVPPQPRPTPSPTPTTNPSTTTATATSNLYPVSPLYSTIGYNVTWFLTNHNPSSPYLFRHDVIPAALRKEDLPPGSPYLTELEQNPLSDYATNLITIDAIPSIAIRFIAEVLDVKINIHINNIYQGTFNMKYIVGDGPSVDFPVGVYNDVDGDGIRDSPALHNTDPQCYIRPFSGERWMSPVIQLHLNDLLSYSFTYQLRPFAKYIPEWANPNDPSFQTQTATTTAFPYAGQRAFVHAILPIESASPDPAELISAPAYKYSVKIRTMTPTSKASMSFTIGRISSQDGGLLGLPPIDSGVCYSTSQQLPLRGRHNVWMRMEFMPVSVLPLSPSAAIRDSEGTLKSGFTLTLPKDLRGPATTTDNAQPTTTMTAVINYVLSTLPPLLEDWWYFDGLMESTSTLLTADDYHATFTSTLDVVAPWPDPDPGLRLRATPSEELMVYAFTLWPQHNDHDVVTTPSLIYSPDSFTMTGRAMGFGQCFPLHSVCF